MKSIQKQCFVYRFGSGISSFCGVKHFILIASFLLFLNGIVFSQETVVVTTVQKPAETEKKDSLTVSEESPAKTVQDTASIAKETNSALLNELVLQTNSVITFDKLSVGLGIGQDFGGFGGNILYYPRYRVQSGRCGLQSWD
jgi:hypothetical protein